MTVKLRSIDSAGSHDGNPVMKYCPACGTEYEAGNTCPADGAVLIAGAVQSDLIGTVLNGAFRVEEKIGAGGMGVVYRGEQLRLDRAVAIKTLLPGLEHNRDLVQRFFREARILSQMHHPNVVQVIDCGNTEGGVFYLVMEYLEGQTLEQHVAGGDGLAFGEILEIFGQVCAGMEQAHGKGLIHRDLKPSNVFLIDDPDRGLVVKVLDFGLARPQAHDDTRLTQAGSGIGTAGYAAPEQFLGTSEPNVQSDVYSLGALVFFAATGTPAYAGRTSSAIFAKQLSEPPGEFDIDRIHSPVELRDIVLRAMHREPDGRHPDVRAFWEDLRALRVDDPSAPATRAARSTPGMPSRRALLMAGGAVAGGAGLLALSSQVWSVSRQPLRFGISAPFSGPAQELGHGMRAGIETRFRAAMDLGELDGRALELDALDDGYEPAQAAANMAGFVGEPDLIGVIGNVGTPTAEVAVPLATRGRLPFIGAFTGADLLRHSPPDRYVFNYRASYAQETAAIVDYFVKLRRIKPDRIAIFAQNDGYGESGARGVLRQLREHDYYQADSVLRVGYDRNTVLVESAVQEVIEHRDEIDAIVIVATYRPSALFVRMLREAGVDVLFANVSFVGSTALEEEFRQFDTRLCEGVIITQVVPHPGSQASAVIEYRERLMKFHPDMRRGFVSLEGYIVASIVVEALRRMESDPTRESLVEAMEQMPDFDLGIGTMLTFGPSDHQASDRVWGTRFAANGALDPLDLT